MALISVVVPVYRSARTLVELHARLKTTLKKMTPSHEIIFVEDRGGDGSWDAIRGICRKDPKARGIQLSRNFGQHAATLCGIERSSGRWIITLDDDLEHQPEYLPLLFAKARKGYDLVYAIYPRRTHAIWRNLASDLARWLFRLAMPSLNDEYTSFRVIRSEVARSLSSFDSPFPFIDGYLSWITNSYSTVKVDHSSRRHGASNYNFRKLFNHTINIFVTFSDLPLKLATWIGLTSFVAGLFGALYILAVKILGNITVSGYASLMVALVTLSGIQLFILGVFGEYLGRINFKTSRKPLYLVSNQDGFKGARR